MGVIAVIAGIADIAVIGKPGVHRKGREGTQRNRLVMVRQTYANLG